MKYLYFSSIKKYFLIIEMKSLLFHISYYSNSMIRLDHKNCLDKCSDEYRNFTIENIKKLLHEINLYDFFFKKVIVFDINDENKDIYKIDFKEYPNLSIRINKYSFKKEHPFRLTTKHRLTMINEIENYDWFGYTEDDTLILKETVNYLFLNLPHFYKNEKKLFTIPRLVFDNDGEFFYSDIVKPSPLRSFYISPTNRFGACWIYSKEILKDWIQCPSFLNFDFPNQNGGIRVIMGSGFLEKIAIIPIDIKKKIPLLQCIHLGYSGKYYFKHKQGFHTLKINKLCIG